MKMTTGITRRWSLIVASVMITILLAALVSAAFGGSSPAGGGGGSSSSSGSAATGGGGGGGTGGRTPTCVSGYVVKDGACVKGSVTKEAKKVEAQVPAVPSTPAETAGKTASLLEEQVPPTVAAGVPVMPTKLRGALAGRAMVLGRVVGESLTTMAWLWVTVLIVIIAGIIALRIRRNKA